MKREMTPNSAPIPGSLVRIKDGDFIVKGLVGKFGIVVTNGQERFNPDSTTFKDDYIVVLIEGVKTAFNINTLERTIELIQ